MQDPSRPDAPGTVIDDLASALLKRSRSLLRERDCIQDKIQAVLTRLKTDHKPTISGAGGSGGSSSSSIVPSQTQHTTGSAHAQQRVLFAAGCAPTTAQQQIPLGGPASPAFTATSQEVLSSASHTSPVTVPRGPARSSPNAASASGQEGALQTDGPSPYSSSNSLGTDIGSAGQSRAEGPSPTRVEQSALSKASAPWRERLVRHDELWVYL